MAISRITVSEVASALARHAREGTLTQAVRDEQFSSFLRDASLMTVLELDPETAEDAAALALSAPRSVRLRTLDMLHVATARLLFSRAHEREIATGSFVSADRGQLDAAAWAGLPVLNPEDQP